MELKDRILAPEIIEAYKELDTTEVADAVNRFGYNTGMFGLNCIVPGTKLAARHSPYCSASARADLRARWTILTKCLPAMSL